MGEKDCVIGEGREGGGREEQPLKRLLGRATLPQAAYVCQPGVRVSPGLIQHASGPRLVINTGVHHGFNGCEEDICPFKRLEVVSKNLREEGKKKCHSEHTGGAA